MGLSEHIRCAGKPALFVTAIVASLILWILVYHTVIKNRWLGQSQEARTTDATPARSVTPTSRQEPNAEPLSGRTPANGRSPDALPSSGQPTAAAPGPNVPASEKEEQQNPVASSDKPQATDSPQIPQAQVKPADAPRPADAETTGRPTATALPTDTASDLRGGSGQQSPNDPNSDADKVRPEDTVAPQETASGPGPAAPAVTATSQSDSNQPMSTDSQPARDADPNAIQPKRSAAELYLQADDLLRQQGISGTAPIRLASNQVAALSQARQMLKQVSELDPNHAPCREAMNVVETWEQSRHHPPSLLLSRLPDHPTIVAYADVKALRLWPGLAEVVDAWIDSPQLTGATAGLRDALRTLAVRPLGAGDSLCVWMSQDPLRGGQICCIGHTQLDWQSLSQAVVAHFKATTISEGSLSFGRYALQNLGDGVIAWGSEKLVQFLSQPQSVDSPSTPAGKSGLWAAVSEPVDTGDVWLAAAQPFTGGCATVLRACGVADSNTVEAVFVRACVENETFQMNATLSLIEVVDSEEAAQRLRQSLEGITSDFKKSSSALQRQVAALTQKVTVVAGEARVECRLRVPSDQIKTLFDSLDRQRQR